jgi:hypothetical protein
MLYRIHLAINTLNYTDYLDDFDIRNNIIQDSYFHYSLSTYKQEGFQEKLCKVEQDFYGALGTGYRPDFIDSKIIKKIKTLLH